MARLTDTSSMSDENKVINLVDHIENNKKVTTDLSKEKVNPYLLHLTPLPVRVTAFGIDIFMVGIIKIAISISYAIYVQTFFDTLDFSQQVYLIHILDGIEVMVAGFVFLSYFTLCFYFMEGRTVGKHLLKLRAVKSDFVADNSNTDLHYSLQDAFMRTLGYLVSYLTLGILYALPFVRKDKRSLADMFSKSIILTNDEVYNVFAYKTKNIYRKAIEESNTDTEVDQKAA
jgi:uncharacterized RDD family membrane protein YckC